MVAPFPAFRTDCPNFLAEDIITFSGPEGDTLSFNDQPMGEDTFKTGLIFPFYGTIFKGFDLKFFTGG